MDIEELKKEFDKARKIQKRRGVKLNITISDYRDLLKTVKEFNDVYNLCKSKKPDKRLEKVLEYYTKRIKKDEN